MSRTTHRAAACAQSRRFRPAPVAWVRRAPRGVESVGGGVAARAAGHVGRRVGGTGSPDPGVPDPKAFERRTGFRHDVERRGRWARVLEALGSRSPTLVS